MINTRLALESDSKVIFIWRNDGLTRSMSLNTDLVAWDGHVKWFESTLKNPNRILIMCLLAETKNRVAIVRFDVQGTRALVSINLAPSMRGKGLGKKCLGESIKFFKENYSFVKALDAEIKDVNIASISSFESIGFTKVKEEQGLLHFEYFVSE